MPTGIEQDTRVKRVCLPLRTDNIRQRQKFVERQSPLRRVPKRKSEHYVRSITQRHRLRQYRAFLFDRDMRSHIYAHLADGGSKGKNRTLFHLFR